MTEHLENRQQDPDERPGRPVGVETGTEERPERSATPTRVETETEERPTERPDRPTGVETETEERPTERPDRPTGVETEAEERPTERPDRPTGYDTEAEERAAERPLPTATPRDSAPEDRQGAPSDQSVSEDQAAATAGDRPASGPAAAPSTEQPFEMLPPGDLQSYRQQWEVVLISFVDDPRAATEQADTLVGDMLQRVMQRYRAMHDELGVRSEGGADTEAMRLALLQYRSFFLSLVGD